MVSQPGCLACTVPDGKTMWLARTAHLMVTKRGKKRSWVKYFYCTTCFFFYHSKQVQFVLSLYSWMYGFPCSVMDLPGAMRLKRIDSPSLRSYSK